MKVEDLPNNHHITTEEFQKLLNEDKRIIDVQFNDGTMNVIYLKV